MCTLDILSVVFIYCITDPELPNTDKYYYAEKKSQIELIKKTVSSIPSSRMLINIMQNKVSIRVWAKTVPHHSSFYEPIIFFMMKLTELERLSTPAVCLSDLYDVFLLDIVRDTRQNLWTMIIGHSDFQIVWGHWQCKTEQVSKVWCIKELFFFGGWVGGRGGG